MPNDSSNFQLICSKCGALYESDASACPGCGHVNSAVPPIYRPSRKQKPARGPILPDLSGLVFHELFVSTCFYLLSVFVVFVNCIYQFSYGLKVRRCSTFFYTV